MGDIIQRIKGVIIKRIKWLSCRVKQCLLYGEYVVIMQGNMWLSHKGIQQLSYREYIGYHEGNIVVIIRGKQWLSYKGIFGYHTRECSGYHKEEIVVIIQKYVVVRQEYRGSHTGNMWLSCKEIWQLLCREYVTIIQGNIVVIIKGKQWLSCRECGYHKRNNKWLSHIGTYCGYHTRNMQWLLYREYIVVIIR